MDRSASLIPPATHTSLGTFPIFCSMSHLSYFRLYLFHLFPYILGVSVPLSTDWEREEVGSTGREVVGCHRAAQPVPGQPGGHNCAPRAGQGGNASLQLAKQPSCTSHLCTCVLPTCGLPDCHPSAGVAANPSLPKPARLYLLMSYLGAIPLDHGLLTTLTSALGWSRVFVFLPWSCWPLCPRVAGSGKNYGFAANLAWKMGCSSCKGREEPKSTAGDRRDSVSLRE